MSQGTTTFPLDEHDSSEPSVFLPGNLLDGARRYNKLPKRTVPAACLLDMKGGHSGQEESLDVGARALGAALAHVRSATAGMGG
jgi:hypothetical protein